MIYIFYGVVIVLVFLDQWFKYMVVANISLHQLVPVVDDFFYLTHVLNTGAAFSFLASWKFGIYILGLISLVASLILLVFIYRLKGAKNKFFRIALSILAAGTIGNMIDRIRLGAVVDYLMFTFGSFVFPVFNLADSCIVVGAIFIAVLLLKNPNILQDNPVLTKKEKIKEQINGQE